MSHVPHPPCLIPPPPLPYPGSPLPPCSIHPPLQSAQDLNVLAEALAGPFMDVVQYNRDNTAFEVGACDYSAFKGCVRQHCL